MDRAKPNRRYLKFFRPSPLILSLRGRGKGEGEGQEGFTLNEILVAVGLIAVGVLGFSLNTMGVIQGNYTSGNVTIATNLAQDKLEEIIALGNFSDVTNAPDPNSPITETGSSSGRFTRTWTIKNSPLESGLKEISVTVGWTDYLIPRQVVLATLVFTG